jgi:NAD(P) transhydrogenase subunit alpha
LESLFFTDRITVLNKGGKIMIIGIPKEIMHDENRVAATPETVAKFIADGATVLIETMAGAGAYFFDKDYEAAGAEIIADVAELYDQAGVILKVKEPLFNTQKNCSEIDLMHEGQYLITFIHPASPVNHEMVKAMAAKGIIGLTLDGIPRISRAQNMDALTSMSTCAGYKGILMGASDVSKFIPQIFSAVGVIQPCNVLIIGAGVAGLQALATAKRLGAVVYAADIRPDAVEQAKSLGAKIIDTGVPVDLAVAEGGYAKALSPEWQAKEREILKEAIKKMDIVFCSALVQSHIAPILISDEMVASMKPGSAIVDISIDQGGNCSATAPGVTTIKYGVTIEGIKNIPGMLPVSSTYMFANNVYNLAKFLIKDGNIVLDMNDEIVTNILTTKDGYIVHEGAREAMGL